jgi:hypothetical protein
LVGDDGCVAAGSWDGSCSVFNVCSRHSPLSSQLQQCATLRHNDGLYGVSLAVFDVPVVATACADNNVYLWRGLGAEGLPAMLQGHKGEVCDDLMVVNCARLLKSEQALNAGESHHVGLRPQRAKDRVRQR